MCIRDRHSPARQIPLEGDEELAVPEGHGSVDLGSLALTNGCLLYTSDAADERSRVDLGGRRIIKKKKQTRN